MLTRSEADKIVSKYVNYQRVPPHIRPWLHQHLDEYIIENKPKRSEIIRFLVKHKEWQKATSLLTAQQIASFLGCAPSLVSRVRARFERSPRQEVRVAIGRPAILPDTSQEAIKLWLEERLAAKAYPTLREFRVRVLEELEAIQSQDVPSQDYYSALLQRIAKDSIEVKVASPLEEERYAVTPEIVQEHFRKLEELGIREIHPDLIVNLDETGIGQSKSGRSKGVKVIVPRGMSGRPTCLERKVTHFVTALATVAAGGQLLRPAFITRRQSNHPDAAELSFFNPAYGPLRYSTPKAFVSRPVFADYLRLVVVPYIRERRAALGNPEAPALIIFDGHKSHIMPELLAVAAEEGIKVYCLPPHSSHLLQALDKGVFRRFKTQYAQMEVRTDLSKISRVLERMWMAYEGTRITAMIWNAWRCTGLSVMVQDGQPTKVDLNPEHVLRKDGLNHAFTGNEAAQGRSTLQPWGILNEGEILMHEAGFCAMCGQELADLEGCVVPEGFDMFQEPPARPPLPQPLAPAPQPRPPQVFRAQPRPAPHSIQPTAPPSPPDEAGIPRDAGAVKRFP